MFKKDGSVHYEGVQNELDTIKFLNEIGRYEDEVIHFGGTKQVSDAKAGDSCISIKHKKGIANGSFDWVNTTKYNNIFGDHFDDFLIDIKEHRKMPENLRKVAEDFIRRDFSNLCNSAVKYLSSKTVINIIKETFKKQEGYDVVINDTKNRNVYIFNAQHHPVLKLIEDGYSVKLVNARGAKSSRKIVLEKNGDEIDSNLRIRVTSNNGITAFLGLSKSNNNSSVVIKLQQDSVHKMLQNTQKDQYTY
jgi:hypothetical protein